MITLNADSSSANPSATSESLLQRSKKVLYGACFALSFGTALAAYRFEEILVCIGFGIIAFGFYRLWAGSHGVPIPTAASWTPAPSRMQNSHGIADSHVSEQVATVQEAIETHAPDANVTRVRSGGKTALRISFTGTRIPTSLVKEVNDTGGDWYMRPAKTNKTGVAYVAFDDS